MKVLLITEPHFPSAQYADLDHAYFPLQPTYSAIEATQLRTSQMQVTPETLDYVTDPLRVIRQAPESVKSGIAFVSGTYFIFQTCSLSI